MRVDTASAAFFQLHLRIKIFLILLHYVGKVGTPATLCMVLLTVAVVVVMMLRGNNLGKDEVHSCVSFYCYDSAKLHRVLPKR